jgi:oxygen-dependent protoporphyrinogen oxidase
VLGATVQEVVQKSDSVVVRYTQDGVEHEVTARYAVLATPAPITRRIAVNLPAHTAEALDQIVYGPYVSAAFLTDETGPRPWDKTYAIATPKRSFNVAFNMSNLVRGSETERAPGSSFMVFSPARFARPLLDRSDEDITATYLQDLEDIFPGFGNLVIESQVQRWPLGLAYCYPGRGRIQPTLMRPAGRMFLAGDYLGTWYTETAVQSGFSAAQDILSALTDRRGRGAAEGGNP